MAIVYFHRRKNDNEVFYVGIGTNKGRAFKISNRTEFWKKTAVKHGYVIEIVHNNITMEEAIEYEIQYIKQFGRKDKGLGNLVNMTDGGEGTLGKVVNEKGREHAKMLGLSNKGRKHSEDSKRRMSESQKGKIVKEETKRKLSEGRLREKHHLYGTRASLETRKKMSESQKGRIIKPESIKKLVETRRKNGTYVITEEMKQKMINTFNVKDNWGKLKKNEREEILKTWNNTEGSKYGLQTKLAKKFKVSTRCINDLIKGKTYFHIEK